MTPLGTGAFDIDGTLLDHLEKPDFLDPYSLMRAKPNRAICARVSTLIEIGVEVHFITGRANQVRDTTLAQLRAYVHESIQERHLHTQEAFQGYAAMSDWKADRLRATGAQWYVGDHAADELAAKKAGIPFKFAVDYNLFGTHPALPGVAA